MKEIQENLFETVEKFKPFEILPATSKRSWIEVREDVREQVQKLETAILAYEDQSTVEAEAALKQFEARDHGDSISNMYVKFRKFLKLVLEMYLIGGYGADMYADEFREGYREVTAGYYGSYFKINAEGKKVIDAVISDIEGLGDQASVIEKEINLLSVVENPNTDREKLYKLWDEVKKLPESQKKAELNDLIKKKLSETNTQFLDTY